jgi:hypothetical protein
LTQTSAGTAKAIFDKYPHANTYSARFKCSNGDIANIDTPGTIHILGGRTPEGEDLRYVINMYAQYYPGRPKYPNSTKDGLKVREHFFHQCLLRVAKIPDLESIAFPWKIGCNLGGGNWEHYLGTLNNFAKYVKEKRDVRTVVYRHEGDE